jgi:hypothetical protein
VNHPSATPSGGPASKPRPRDERGDKRILVITDMPPAGASPAFTAAWMRRQRANATGRCECGAVIEMPNRAQRRAAKARGSPPRATMLHEADCPATDAALRGLYLAGLN